MGLRGPKISDDFFSSSWSDDQSDIGETGERGGAGSQGGWYREGLWGGESEGDCTAAPCPGQTEESLKLLRSAEPERLQRRLLDHPSARKNQATSTPSRSSRVSVIAARTGDIRRRIHALYVDADEPNAAEKAIERAIRRNARVIEGDAAARRSSGLPSRPAVKRSVAGSAPISRRAGGAERRASRPCAADRSCRKKRKARSRSSVFSTFQSAHRRARVRRDRNRAAGP